MTHESKLIALIAVGFVLALGFGFLAARLRLPPLIGYLLAGVAIGPFTPGFVADTGLASELAEIGVILLMFGVGLHFSVDSLLRVRTIALPGAVVQIASRRRSARCWLPGGAGAKNPRIAVVARTHSHEELAYLSAQGVERVVMGEVELALEMTESALHNLGVPEECAREVTQSLRESQ